MNRRLVFWIKLTVLIAVLGAVGFSIFRAWHEAAPKLAARQVDWRYGLLAIAGFSGSILTSALVWRWLAWKMADRSPTIRLLGAYTFSQMGKYIPGKVALLLMRIDRANRFGMTPGVCTLSTLLENALYMISGGLVGMLAIAHIADGLPQNLERWRFLLWPVTIAAVLILASACHPRVFYGLVNALLKKMKKPPVEKLQQLAMPTLALATVAFVPCWLFGGVALWASTRCLQEIPIASSAWFAGAYSLSVIIGMASLLPGGAGVREAVLAAAVTLALTQQGMNQNQAWVIAGIVSILQRIFQIIVEVLLGLAGGAVTTLANPKPR